jgi:hypothetical protein
VATPKELDALGENPAGVGSFDEVTVVTEQHDILAALVLERGVIIDDCLIPFVSRYLFGVPTITQPPVVVLTKSFPTTRTGRLIFGTIIFSLVASDLHWMDSVAR